MRSIAANFAQIEANPNQSTSVIDFNRADWIDTFFTRIPYAGK